MQKMSYTYFLYFYKQQSMQNQNYRSVPLSQDFQPIQVKLETNNQSKDVDFKLFVLLIIIIFLGILISKYEQKLELQTLKTINCSNLSYTAQNLDLNHPNPSQTITIKAIEENQKSLSPRKQLYSLDRKIQRNMTLTNEKTYLEQNNQQHQQNKLDPIKGNPLQNIQRQKQYNLRTEKQPSEMRELTKYKAHRNLLKKYVEFYFWFPFFIFALIVYSCYQKQYAENSIFISVKKIHQMQTVGALYQCAICITQMKKDDLLAALPCSSKHLFHSECIKQWLELKKTCPICRCDVREGRRHWR